MSSNVRYQQLQSWLKSVFTNQSISLTPLTGDAGFRVYYRLSCDNSSYIVVDADPKKLNNDAFVSLTKQFAKQNIMVPDIIHYQVEQGFMVISDFGDVLLSSQLTEQSVANYYQKAIELLPNIAEVQGSEEHVLPIYDGPFLQMEMEIFTDWLLAEHLGLAISEQQRQSLQQCFSILINSALEQPVVTVHRDYHSRNIMLDKQQNLAVIDYQDAVKGPFTYDLVSLLRDCYVKWDNRIINPLVSDYFYSHAQKIAPQSSLKDFQRWFDLMGLQRHIKASGIFARLYHRDGKPGYLNDIPLTLSYIVDVAGNYPELHFLSDFVADTVMPALKSLKQENPLRHIVSLKIKLKI